MKNVTMIPATISRMTQTPINEQVKRKVAAYARVSTDQEEQLTSYEAQVDYYTGYIQSREDWEFVSVYTDEGISGTNTKHREGFKSMVEDALAGKIDLIITKSVSRFARNTVDSLTTIRKLKDNGVECYFEKENIWTFDGKGELLITIMSSLAQEESRSMSENVTWGHRKRFADGKVMVAYSCLLGYEKGPEGGLVVNEEQAKIVRRIYRMFLEGITCFSIAKQLTAEGIPTPMGKEKWRANTVESILTNEKYKGDALLQKKYTVDFLTKRMEKNTGQVPQYYVENDHEAIVSREVFEAAQQEMARRRRGNKRYSGVGIFSSKIVCAECGGYYGAKVWHSNDKYRRVVYRCNRKYDNGSKCSTPALSEDEIKEAFLKAVNILLADKKELIQDIEELRDMLCDNDGREEERTELRAEMTVLVEAIEAAVSENARVAQDQKAYQKKYNELARRYEETKSRYDELGEQIADNLARREKLTLFIKALKKQDAVTEFDDAVWSTFVESVRVRTKEDITFVFRDGTEITV